MKRLIKSLFTLFWLIFMFVSISLLTWEPLGYGIKIYSRDEPNEYTLVMMNYPYFSKTISSGDFPEVNSELNVEHKADDEYWNLSFNERIEYDAILNHAKKIWNGETMSLDVRVPLDSFDWTIPVKMSCFNDSVDEAVDEIDHKAVFRALHRDYDWLFWFEHNMRWTIHMPDICVNDGSISGSSYQITLTPASKYEATGGLSADAIKSMLRARTTLQSLVNASDGMSVKDKLEYFKNEIISRATYDNDMSDMIEADIGIGEEYLEAKSITSLFDEENLNQVVCSGYANAFQVLCDLSGLECYEETGTYMSRSILYSNNDTASSHAWNKIKIDDEYYLVDLTNTEKGTVGENGGLFKAKIDNSDSYQIYTNGVEVTYIEE